MADVGQTLRATVSASKGGSAVTPSQGFSPVTAVIAPRATTLPSVSGTPTDGQVLSVAASSAAAWDGASGLAFTYQWYRCDTSGANCAAITGATNVTYTLTPDDVATLGDATHAQKKLKMRVTATINGATTFADSATTPAIGALPTQITTLPVATGSPLVGGILTVQTGGWAGTAVKDVSYQWVSCDAGTFLNCTNLGTASADLDHVHRPALRRRDER